MEQFNCLPSFRFELKKVDRFPLEAIDLFRFVYPLPIPS